mmetsp:Transcript_9529/g.29024  ORF Transcript_9529/g.29024 Transcript_9529/m.29024 type:complete len:235 (+) Transcript_9529:313-1017(+)
MKSKAEESGVVRLRVGVARPWWTRDLKAAWRALAAPRRWPMALFVEVTAMASAASPRGVSVDVAEGALHHRRVRLACRREERSRERRLPKDRNHRFRRRRVVVKKAGRRGPRARGQRRLRRARSRRCRRQRVGLWRRFGRRRNGGAGSCEAGERERVRTGLGSPADVGVAALDDALGLADGLAPAAQAADGARFGPCEPRSVLTAPEAVFASSRGTKSVAVSIEHGKAQQLPAP